jgi:hypothetical protein
LRRTNNLVGGPLADPYNQKAVLTELFFSKIVGFEGFIPAGILVKGKI